MPNPPPGNSGLPFLGETFSLLANPYAFQEERRAQFGPIFRSKILGRDFVFLSGPEGMTAFLDPERVSRQNGHPAHVRTLFGGLNMGMLDGPRPTVLKKMLLQAFQLPALDRYIPQVEPLVIQALKSWSAKGTLALEEELQRLAVEAIAKNVLGLDPGPEVDALRADYVTLTAGFLATPIPFPGTTYSKALKAKDRMLARFQKLIAEHRASPKEDGLSMALAATPEDGVAATDQELILELNHVFIAGYIVYALLAELLIQLAKNPELKAKTLTEVQSVETPLTMRALSKCRGLAFLAMEAKRTAPIVPFAFGSVKKTFELGGYTIPEGWGVQLALTLSNANADIFHEPRKFDPDRFAEPRSEHLKHPHAWHPQGSGPPEGHRCLGVEYSTMIACVFLIHALKNYNWELPPQDLDYKWNLIPAGFKDGLKVSFKEKTNKL